MVRAGELLAVDDLFPLAVVLLALVAGGLLDEHQQNALRELQRGLHRVRQADADAVPDDQPVHHGLDVVLLILVQVRDAADVVDGAVHAGADEALPLDVGEDVLVLALLAADQRGTDLDLGLRRPGQDRLDDLRGMLAGDLPAADPAVRLAHAGEEQPEVVVDLRRRGDGRARVAAGAALLDGDGGRQARDIGHRGLLHLFEELPGVGAERFDVLAPALGVDRVEGQRAFARAADAGDDDELVARDVQTDILQVVLGGTGNPDDFLCVVNHSPCRVCTRTPFLVGLVCRCAMHTLPLVFPNDIRFAFALVHLHFSQTAQTAHCSHLHEKVKSLACEFEEIVG